MATENTKIKIIFRCSAPKKFLGSDSRGSKWFCQKNPGKESFSGQNPLVSQLDLRVIAPFAKGNQESITIPAILISV
uniref:Uncharacterized protein n=1 Tax=Romanomermis culicivorax TaxID=13658 RepID=A0A915KG39_ROMCU